MVNPWTSATCTPCYACFQCLPGPLLTLPWYTLLLSACRYVLWDDGSTAWEGLPWGLHNQLNGRQKSLPGVEDLGIGPNGEWWVRFLNGSWRANGLSDSCSDAIDELQADGHEIGSIAFGHDWSWAIRYS